MTSDVLKSTEKPSIEYLSAKEKFDRLPAKKRAEMVRAMSDEDAAKLQFDWEFLGRPKQLAPDHKKSKATSYCMCAYLRAQSQTDKKLKIENFPGCHHHSKVEQSTLDRREWVEDEPKTNVIITYEPPDEDGWKPIQHLTPNVWIKEVPNPNEEVCEFRKSWATWVLLAGRGFGKASDINTPVPTPNGWKKLGEITDGDIVFNELGEKTTVVKAHDKYFTDDVYELTFSDKTSIVVDKEHLWTFWEHLDNKQYGRYDENIDSGSFPNNWATFVGEKYDCHGNVVGHFGAKTFNTEELKNRLHLVPRIPLTRPLQLPNVELPIHPWVLGYWLGNGDTRDGGVHTGSHLGEMDFEHIKSQFEKFKYPLFRADPRTTCGFISSKKLHEELLSQNLLGNKHIPPIYLRASKEQRLLLLQGLMDSDGGAGNENSKNYVGFSSTIQNLADGVYELAISLGEKPRQNDGYGMLYGVKKKYCWSVSYRPNINPFTLPRKRDRITPPEYGKQGLRHKHRIVKSIEKVEGRYVRCLTVDSPSSLYLIGKQMVPTHNTRVGAELAREMVETGQARRIAVISPTASDARDVAVEGQSGLVSVCPPWARPLYESTKRKVTWPNGAQASLFSAEEPERLRGPQFDFAWVDEIAGYDINTQQMTWDMLQFTLRLGNNPRCVVTTTPKPTPLIQQLVKLARHPINKIVMTTGSTYENKTNLAAPFMRQITQYEGTNLGRQEIYAELIDIEESGILKRSWFKQWPAKKAMPLFEFVIQSYDTAFTEKTENDPTGCVTFGVFRPSPDEPHCVMILDCWTEHLKYPELRKKAVEEFKCTYGDQEAPVDLLLIEDKGSGIPLIQDLQRAGLPIRKYNPGRPDKTMRLHAVSHLVYNGRVYIPESKQVPGEFVTWSEDFLREVCSFPNSAHDEMVDCLSQSLAVFRDQEWISIDPEPEKNQYEEDDDGIDGQYKNPYDG